MEHITRKFFIENKINIGVTLQPRNILDLTKDYIERKQKMLCKIEEIGVKLKTNNKYGFDYMLNYFSLLKLKGIDDIEKDNGTKGQILVIETQKKVENNIKNIKRKIDIIDELAENEENKIIAKETQIILPGLNRLISDYVDDISKIIKTKNCLFFRTDSREIVEIGKIKGNKDKEDTYTGFLLVKPNKFITLCEKYFTPGVKILNKDINDFEFKSRSMSAILSKTVLESAILQDVIPQINRIFTIPIPIIYDGKLTFPKKGYDERFNSWMPENAPTITEPDMSLEAAQGLIYEIFKEFCFETKQDYVNAIAGLLTPFLRGLFPRFSTRTPVFFYIANRERAGKDFCAGITGLLYEGIKLEETPLSTSENAKSNNTDELRKKILSAMISGKKRLHFSNNKGYINNAVLEAVLTSVKHSDRILGRSEMLTFENEIDFSLSGNTGIGFTPDLANRCRFIRLFLKDEDANARKFKRPNLNEWILDNREKIISALYSLVNNWFENDKKEGTVPYTSFTDWAKICGGIMESAGYTSPCTADEKTNKLGGDRETEEMKELFELCYEKYEEKDILKQDIINLIKDDENNLFGFYNWEDKSSQIKFSFKLLKFVGREFSNITFSENEEENENKRASRKLYRFTKSPIKKDKNIFDFNIKKNKDGNDGNDGNENTTLKYIEKNNNNEINTLRSNTTNITNITTQKPKFSEDFDVEMNQEIHENDNKTDETSEIKEYDPICLGIKEYLITQILDKIKISFSVDAEQSEAIYNDWVKRKIIISYHPGVWQLKDKSKISLSDRFDMLIMNNIKSITEERFYEIFNDEEKEILLKKGNIAFLNKEVLLF